MTNKLHQIRNCTICSKSIQCYTQTIGRGGRRLGQNGNMKTPIFTRMLSDEGVLFDSGADGRVWFCNTCWLLLLKGVTAEKI